MTGSLFSLVIKMSAKNILRFFKSRLITTLKLLLAWPGPKRSAENNQSNQSWPKLDTLFQKVPLSTINIFVDFFAFW
jgi:hypothetical protein